MDHLDDQSQRCNIIKEKWWKLSETKVKETVSIKLGLNMKNIEIEEAHRERFDESQDRLQ